MITISVAIGEESYYSVNGSTLSDPKEIYNGGCAQCHGIDGKGKTKMGIKNGVRDYTVVAIDNDNDKAYFAIKNGLKDKNDMVIMKQSDDLTDFNIKEVIRYMTSLKLK